MPGYTLPNGTLKNKLGADTPAKLELLEADLVAARNLEIAMGEGPRGNFDLDHMKALHRHLFQDVYEWAGHARDERFRLSDGQIAHEPTLKKKDGQPFGIGTAATEHLERTFAHLAADNYLRGLDSDRFADRAGAVLANLNSAHVFREGNGRTQRAFMAALASQAGHNLDFRVVSRERMVQASIAAHELNDIGGFQRMIREISDPERVAALREAQSFLDNHRNVIDWRDHYMATTEGSRTYTFTMVGIAGPNFMARTGNEILVGRSVDLPAPPPANGETVTITTAARQTAEVQTRQQGQSRDIDTTALPNEAEQKCDPHKY